MMAEFLNLTKFSSPKLFRLPATMERDNRNLPLYRLPQLVDMKTDIGPDSSASIAVHDLQSFEPCHSLVEMMKIKTKKNREALTGEIIHVLSC